MSDLLERVAKLVYGGDWQMRNSKRVVALLSDATDVIEKRDAEIERLRAALEGIPDAFETAINYLESDTFMGSNDEAWIAGLRAKVAAIRDVLATESE